MLAHSFDGEVEAANCTDVLGKPAALRLSAKFENLKREAVKFWVSSHKATTYGWTAQRSLPNVDCWCTE